MIVLARALTCVAVTAGLATPPGAHAQAYPSRQIQVVSSANVGSGGDIALRALVNRISVNLGQGIVVESRPGGGGTLAASAVTRAAPDGYTLLYATTGTLVISRFLLKNLPFDSEKDFAPVSLAFSLPSFLVVHASVPVGSVRELVDYAKRNPGKLLYGSTGIGSPFHIIGESFKMSTGTSLRHIPYNAGNASVQQSDFVAGRIQVYFPTYAAVRPHLQGGKLKVIAVIDNTRSRLMPDIPTVSETLPGFYNLVAWYAFLGPQGLPPAVAERFSVEVRKGLEDPSVAGKMSDLGIVTHGTTPEALATWMRKDIENIGKVVAALGIKPE